MPPKSPLFLTVEGKDSLLTKQNCSLYRYFPGFDIIVAINNYILWNVTKSRVSKYSSYPTLACPEQGNLLTAKQKDWPWAKHHLRRRLKQRKRLENKEGKTQH